MKKSILFAALSALLCSCASGTFETRKTFDENAEIFQNPGQGWLRFGNSLKGSQNSVNFGAGYERYTWARLNPEEGVYDWKPIDRALENFSREGLPFYFRIMCVNTSGYPPFYQTPKWVFDKGAKYTVHEMQKEPDKNKKYPDGKVKIAVPEFGDPVFIREHEKFIKALAARYDGDPRIGGLDLGSYGNWGEWHCTSLGLKKPDVRPHSPEIRRKYADMYLQNFKKTPLIFMTDDHETLEYALGKGEKPRVGIRRDGVGSPSHFKRWIGRWPYENIRNMGDIWKDMPAIFEFFGSVEMMRGRGWDIPYSLGWVLENHACLVNEGPLAPRQIAEGSGEEKLLRDIDLFAGARLVPQSAEVSYAGGKLKIRICGENKGASKIYLPYRFVYVLRGDSGDAAEMLSARDPREILPGKFEFCDEFEVPLERGKEYSLSLRVRHSAGVLKDFRFAAKNLNPDGSLGLGKILIK